MESRLELVISSRQAERDLDRLNGRLNSVDQAGSRAQGATNRLSGELGGLRTVALAASGALAAMGVTAFGRDVFNTVASVEKMRASLATVTGSIEGANQAWDQMREFAKTTPFELDQAVQGFIRMKSLGLDPTEESMRAFANTAAAMNTDLMQMVEAVADATVGEFERLREYGIRASQDGDRVALTFQGVTTEIGNNAREIQRYLENIGNVTFADAAIDQMDTLGGKANNLSDSITDLYVAIGEAGATDLFNAALDGSADAVDYLTNNVESLAKGVDLLGDAAIIAAGIYSGRLLGSITAVTGAKLAATGQAFAYQRALASMAGVSTAAAAGQTALAGATRAASGALALIGGPAGAALLAVGAIVYFREELGLTQQAIGYTEEELASLRQEMADMDGVQITQTLSQVEDALMQVGLKAAAAREELAQLRSESGGSGVLGFEGGRVGEEIRGMQAVAEYTEKMTELEQKRDVIKDEINGTSEAMDTMVVTASRLTGETEKLTKAQRDAIKEANDHADALNGLLNEVDPLRAAHQQYTERLETLNRGLSEGTITTQEYGEALRWAAGEYTDIASGADDAKKALEQLTQQYDSQYQRGVQLTQAISDINAAYRRGDIDGQQYGRMIQGVRDEMAELALEADPMAQEMARAWEEATNRIDETFSDAFAGAFDSFDSFADSLLDGFKRLLAELAYQATLKPIVVGFTADMQSMLGSSSGSAGGGLNGIGSLINSGKSLLGFGSGSAAAAGGLYSGASTGAAVGGLYGNAATGGLASTGLASSITSGISAAMPWLAGGALVDNVLGLGITDGITKALSGLFGSDRKSYGQIGSQIGGDTNAGDGVYRYDRNDRSMGWAQQTALGTIGVTKKQKTDDDALIEMVAGLAQFDNTLASVMTAAQLEQTRTALDGWKSSRTENIGGLVDERLSAVMNATKSVFTDVLSQFEGEALVQGLVGGLQVENAGAQMAAAVAADMNAEFREALGSGSDVQAATQSILSSAQAVQTLGGAVDRLNLQFDATAAGALGAAGNLANLVGGTDNLNSLLSGYYDAFYTEQEKFDNLASDLRGTFADMGRELPTTREGVRSVVESLQLMGEAGQEQLATILQLNQPLSQYIAAMEAQKAAAEKSAQAERELAAQRSLSLSYGALAGIDGALDDYNAAVSLSETLASERRSQLEDELRAVEQLRGLVDSLMLSNQSILDPMERMQESQRQLAELQARAEGGDTAAVGQLQGASTAYLDAAAAYYGQSSSQYAAIFGDVTSSVSSLEQQYGDSADTLGSIEGIEQQMLREQQRARDLLMSQLNAQIDAAAGITSLAGLLGELPSSIADALSGIITTQGRYGAVTSEGEYVSDAGFNDTQRAINDIYNDALGRNAETEGLDYWADQFRSGKSLDRIRDEIENAAVHGAHADGLGTVPFDGYTAKLHKGETVLPAPLAEMYRSAAPGSQAVDLEPLTRELAALRQEVAMLRSERRTDASVAADQRSKQLGEQKKINKNVKLKERVS